MVTQEQIVKAVSGTEYRTLQSIGDDFGVTRERIRQLLNKHNLNNVVARKRPDIRKECPVCKLPVDAYKRIKKRVFKHGEGNDILNGFRGEWVNKNFRNRSRYHSACKENFWTSEVCTGCEITFRLRKKDLQWRISREHRLFCSRECYYKNGAGDKK